MKRGKITTENYKKFQHRECEFFPCHQGVPEDEFNCLFCYCPLYMLKDKCGGNFRYTNGIKDCSGCTKPHDKNAFDHVMSKIGLVIEGGKRSSPPAAKCTSSPGTSAENDSERASGAASDSDSESESNSASESEFNSASEFGNGKDS